LIVRLSHLAAICLVLAGCRIGPDFVRPDVPKAEGWSVERDARLAAREADARWWRAFRDPALESLVDEASVGNPTLRAAGLRVLQARGRRAIAIGGLFPQRQAAVGSITRSRASREIGSALPSEGTDAGEGGLFAAGERTRTIWQTGFDAAWELDFWGRFRRAIEAADAELLATLADYDDVWVTLVAELAASYVELRLLDERLGLAGENVAIQREALELARARFEAGGTSSLDVHQATALVADTEATIPALAADRRRVIDTIAVLVGVPPSGFEARLPEAAGVPEPPASIALGIPADLLRRRPDVRRAEQRLAAQSARIGVTAADLLPRIELAGSIGWSAEDAADLFTARSLRAAGGPRFDWPILNYGRIVNAVRVENAQFEELAASYVGVVLRAQKDVEDALSAYLRGLERVERLTEAAAAADRAVEVALIQYREGAADFTRVLTAQQAKLQEEDRLALARGEVTLAAVALYKALGGGWEIRADAPVVSEETAERMRARAWIGTGSPP
jgi:NodT family efflux transporter outer membrane factor (OMF) lipoprotein